MSPILDFDPARRTNSQAIADLARLGMIHTADRVLDVTVGPHAGFWNDWRPDSLTTNDTDPSVTADHRWDARAIPRGAGAFDVTVFDPPYANRGTSRLAMDSRYGVTEYRSRTDVESLIVDGSVEALRVASRLALIKCQDASVASRYAPQTFLVWEAMRDAGGRLLGEMHVVGRRSQPAGKRQRNIWSACSTLMVFGR